jgi:hypothetical protein
MRIEFDVAGTPAEFWRSSETGRVELRIGDVTVLLQSQFELYAHVEFRTIQAWRAGHGEHEVEIMKVKPRFSRGPSVYTISVDGTVVWEATGT